MWYLQGSFISHQEILVEDVLLRLVVGVWEVVEQKAFLPECKRYCEAPIRLMKLPLNKLPNGRITAS
ncbi:hypothetical protein NIES2130_39150 [Scytonema sp. HK-05]|nr:hypothetical protein NIES2130_39150 [Scytonema sp. HK-05]